MKRSPTRKGKSGFVSYLMVLSTGAILLFLMIHAYRRAMSAHAVQSDVQLRNDYSEKEDAVLRALVAITPNRAMRAMQNGSNADDASRNALSWESIFTESLQTANSVQSISDELAVTMELKNHVTSNFGDSELTEIDRIFRAVGGEEGFVSEGINRDLGDGFPAPLNAVDADVIARDRTHPLISDEKQYGADAITFLNNPFLNGDGVNAYGVDVNLYAATDRRRNFNCIRYPNINFGYSTPGDVFVAKRNWWAFSMNMGNHDNDRTFLTRPTREFVLSIYEIPSQLAISADSFVALGNLNSGEAWQNISIEGNVFASRASVEGALPSLASRRRMVFQNNAEIGGIKFDYNPFTPGAREKYEVENVGRVLPVSLSSESGRTAFIPINRGNDFYDRFATSGVMTNVISPTGWNEYSTGAHQCAMRLDIIAVDNATNRRPRALRFSYMRNGVRQEFVEALGPDVAAPLPPGYEVVANDGETVDYGNAIVDVAYGAGTTFIFKPGVTGNVTFNSESFGVIPNGTPLGYARPTRNGLPVTPYEVKEIRGSGVNPQRTCVAIYPERFAAFLALIGADGTDINHSIVVNVDYNVAMIPATAANDYGLIIEECSDLSAFPRGFSVVTNLRTYIGNNFNTVPVPPPVGYPAGRIFYPPTSIFCPQIRYGVDIDPFDIIVEGQVNSLANEGNIDPVRPTDSRTMTGNNLNAADITMNLRPITHPADLPPITMMHWLVVLEELRREFITED